MSQNSYELRKQKIEAEAAEAIQKLRGERHYSHEDVETMIVHWNWKSLFWFVTGVLVAETILHFIK